MGSDGELIGKLEQEGCLGRIMMGTKARERVFTE